MHFPSCYAPLAAAADLIFISGSIPVLFSEGDPVQFEAVPQEGNADDPASSYCSWFATLVWKGKRPPVEPYAFDSPYTTVTAANAGTVQQVWPVLSPDGGSVYRI